MNTHTSFTVNGFYIERSNLTKDNTYYVYTVDADGAPEALIFTGSLSEAYAAIKAARAA